MRVGRTFSERFRVETRQHNLIGLDLGEGPKRRDLRITLVLAAIWLLIWAPILGVPNQFTTSIYVIPPAIVIALGVQPSTVHPQRIRLFEWTRRWHYALVGSRTVVNLGRRQPNRRELVPIAERVHWREIGRYILPWTIGPAWEQGHRAGNPVGPLERPTRISQKVRLIGNDRLHSLWSATVGRKKGTRH